MRFLGPEEQALSLADKAFLFPALLPDLACYGICPVALLWSCLRQDLSLHDIPSLSVLYIGHFISHSHVLPELCHLKYPIIMRVTLPPSKSVSSSLQLLCFTFDPILNLPCSVCSKFYKYTSGKDVRDLSLPFSFFVKATSVSIEDASNDPCIQYPYQSQVIVLSW